MHNGTGLLTNAKWELSQCKYLEGELDSKGQIWESGGIRGVSGLSETNETNVGSHLRKGGEWYRGKRKKGYPGWDQGLRQVWWLGSYTWAPADEGLGEETQGGRVWWLLCVPQAEQWDPWESKVQEAFLRLATLLCHLKPPSIYFLQ